MSQSTSRTEKPSANEQHIPLSLALVEPILDRQLGDGSKWGRRELRTGLGFDMTLYVKSKVAD